MRSLPIGCALALVLVLAGCAAIGEDPSNESTPDVSPPPSLPDRSSIQLPSSRPGPASPEGDTLTGTFGADSVEGGCAYLEADDGTRYEIIYPEGWRVQATPLQLTDPNGRVVATGGESITVIGGQADDMASICMIGPIFQASDVVSIEPATGS
jgi:hypothetical protein